MLGQHGLDIALQLRLVLLVGLVCARHIVQQQNDVGLFDLRPGAFHADLFHLVGLGVVAQARRIEHMDGHAFNLNRLTQDVAGGASHRRDDGQFGARQGVEQRAFTCIGLPSNHQLQTIAQQRALLGLGGQGGGVVQQGLQLLGDLHVLDEIQIFFGEVQAGFDLHPQMHQRVFQRMDLI